MSRVTEKQFEEQQEIDRECDADREHATEIFKAQSGKLYWRCSVCIEKSGPFVGKPKLLGADGDNKKKRTRVEPTTESGYSFTKASGVYQVSLQSIAQQLERHEERQLQILAKLEQLEKRFVGQ